MKEKLIKFYDKYIVNINFVCSSYFFIGFFGFEFVNPIIAILLYVSIVLTYLFLLFKTTKEFEGKYLKISLACIYFISINFLVIVYLMVYTSIYRNDAWLFDSHIDIILLLTFICLIPHLLINFFIFIKKNKDMQQ